MRYTLRQLQVFLAAARYENVSRAAETLAMSQSAASGALKELEQQFDVLLFDRIGKRLKLSELGRQLRPQAEALLAQARDFEQSLAGTEVKGTLRIGATLTIGNYLAVKMIADFRKQYPGTAVTLEVANTKTIAQQVADFEIDLGMIEGELHHPDLSTTPRQTTLWRKSARSMTPSYCPRTGSSGNRAQEPGRLSTAPCRAFSQNCGCPWSCSIRKPSSER